MTLTRTGSCVSGCWISAPGWCKAVAGDRSGYASAWGGAQASGPAAVGNIAGPSSSVNKLYAVVGSYVEILKVKQVFRAV